MLLLLCVPGVQDTQVHVYNVYLEPKWPLFWLEKARYTVYINMNMFSFYMYMFNDVNAGFLKNIPCFVTHCLDNQHLGL